MSRLLAELDSGTLEGDTVRRAELLRPGIYKGREYDADYMRRLAGNMQEVEQRFGYRPPYRLGHPSDEELDEVWANPDYVKGHWTNFTADDQGRVLADCVIEDPDERAAIDRGQRRALSVDIIHDYEVGGQAIGPFLKAGDAVDAPACLTASFLAAHDNGEEFGEDITAERRLTMSTFIDRLKGILGLTEDASEEDVAKLVGERLSASETETKTEEEEEEPEVEETETDDPNIRDLRQELQAERKQREKLAAELADEREQRHNERADAKADAVLSDLSDGGYITPAQEEAYRPMVRDLARRDDDQLGEGEDAKSPLQAFADGTREGGPLVQLGHEKTTTDPDEEADRKAKAERMAAAAGAKIESNE